MGKCEIARIESAEVRLFSLSDRRLLSTGSTSETGTTTSGDVELRMSPTLAFLIVFSLFPVLQFVGLLCVIRDS